MSDFKANHWALLDLKYYFLDDGFQLVATTDVPCHLYCRMTLTPPRKHVLPAFRRGIYLQGDVRFCFVVYEDNEQDEAGDTLTHTWMKTAWPVCETRWCYFVGSQNGAPSVSETAMFKFHFTGPGAPIFLYPNGVGDETNIPRESPAAWPHWQIVRELQEPTGSWRVYSYYYMRWDRDLYTIDSPPPGIFDHVNLRCYGGQTYSYHRYKYVLRMPGVGTWESAEHGWPAAPREPTREGFVEELLLNPLTGLAWTLSDLDELQLGVSLNEIGSFGEIFINWLYIELVNFHHAGT